MKNKDLKRRIIEISYKNKLSHLGSCLTASDIIEEIYSIKKPDEKFILSSGHAGVALYAVIEKHEGVGAEKIFKHHGVHPDRCTKCHLDCSTGSLGQGLPIAVGMALANRTKNVYCLISDGEATEGSIWEALRIKNQEFLYNLKVYCNWNSYSAYSQTFMDINTDLKDKNVIVRYKNMDDYPKWLQGLEAHYAVVDSEDKYKELLEAVK